MSDAEPNATEAVADAAVTPAQPLHEVIAGRPQRQNRRAPLVMLLAGAVAVGGIAFAAGRLTAPASGAAGLRGSGQLPGGQAPTGQLPGGGEAPGDGQGFPGDGRTGGMTVSGTVTAVTADAITIELASGTTVTIPVDAATTYRTATSASADAVLVGREVAVTPGSRTTDPDSESGTTERPALGPATRVTVVEP
jgi:hypothetical protein